METLSRKSNWIPTLHSLRGIAALCVAIAHYAPITCFGNDNSQKFFPFLHKYALPNFSVGIFFGLSAFLLSYLAETEYRETQSFSILKFYIRRILRIWPLYFFILIVSLFLIRPDHSTLFKIDYYMYGVWEWTIKKIYLFYSFLYNWSLTFNHSLSYEDHSISYVNHFWSIALEEQFYFVFPLIMYFTLPSFKFLKKIVFISIILGIVLRATTIFVTNDVKLYFATFSYIDLFLVCSLLGVLYAKQSASYKFIERMVNTIFGKIILLSLLILFLRFWAKHLWPPYRLSEHALTLNQAFLVSSIYTVLAILVGFTLVLAVSPRKSLMKYFLENKFFQKMGTLSYGIYLWHFIAIVLIRYLDIRFIASLSPPFRFFGIISLLLLYIALCITLASLSYFFIEYPFLNLKKFFKTKDSFNSLNNPQNQWHTLKYASFSTLSIFAILVLIHKLTPLNPTFVSYAQINPQNLRIYWQPSADIETYSILMLKEPNGYQEVGRVNGVFTKFDVSDLIENAQYRFLLRACYKNGVCEDYGKELNLTMR